MHLDKGCYGGQETVARVHNLGRPPRMLVLLHLDACRESSPLRAIRCSPAADRSAVWAPVVDRVEVRPIALALVKQGLPAEAPLVAGGQHPVTAGIDPDWITA